MNLNEREFVLVILLFELFTITVSEEFDDTKEVIRSRKSKGRQYNGQKKKDKQRSKKHNTEHKRSSK